MQTTDKSLSVREIQTSDIASIRQYWQTSDEAYLRGMGADPAKLPDAETWATLLAEPITQPYEEKKSYCLIWQLDGRPVGHSNTNKIVFGREAYMHLHIWTPEVRRQGLGAAFVRLSLPWFFQRLQLEKLFCEPYALNPGPNKTLEKTGFTFVKTYTGTPGWINFEQEVNLWEMSRAQWEGMSSGV